MSTDGRTPTASRKRRFSTALLGAAIETRCREMGVSYRQALREMGEASPSVLISMREDRDIRADRAARMMLWLGVKDFAVFMVDVPEEP